MDEYLENFKKRKKTFNEDVKINIISKKRIHAFISKFLIAIIFLLVSVIYTNISDDNLITYKKYVLTESLPFTKIKGWYENMFGEVIPELESNEQMVFKGKLMYKDISDYLDGSKLTLSDNTIVNSLNSGIVVFIGDKEGYGNTVIVQGSDGADIWYGNIKNVPVKLYDYISKESILGESNGEELYIVIKKDNEFIKYEDYQN